MKSPEAGLSSAGSANDAAPERKPQIEVVPGKDKDGVGKYDTKYYGSMNDFKGGVPTGLLNIKNLKETQSTEPEPADHEEVLSDSFMLARVKRLENELTADLVSLRLKRTEDGVSKEDMKSMGATPEIAEKMAEYKSLKAILKETFDTSIPTLKEKVQDASQERTLLSSEQVAEVVTTGAHTKTANSTEGLTSVSVDGAQATGVVSPEVSVEAGKEVDDFMRGISPGKGQDNTLLEESAPDASLGGAEADPSSPSGAPASLDEDGSLESHKPANLDPEVTTEEIAPAQEVAPHRLEVLTIDQFANKYGSKNLDAIRSHGIEVGLTALAHDIDSKMSPNVARFVASVGAGVTATSILASTAGILGAPVVVLTGGLVLIPVVAGALAVYGGLKLWKANRVREVFKRSFGKSVEQVLGKKK
jgi:hypothetical protein